MNYRKRWSHVAMSRIVGYLIKVNLSYIIADLELLHQR